MSDLSRFHKAQKIIYEIALEEIRNGEKEGHWMWFIFPQLRGLGISETSEYYGIKDLDEAKDYLNDEILGPHLEKCCEAIIALGDVDIEDVFWYPDNLKLCSSMTLFEAASGDNPIFGQVLDAYYDGERDLKTLEMLRE